MIKHEEAFYLSSNGSRLQGVALYDRKLHDPSADYVSVSRICECGKTCAGPPAAGERGRKERVPQTRFVTNRYCRSRPRGGLSEQTTGPAPAQRGRRFNLAPCRSAKTNRAFDVKKYETGTKNFFTGMSSLYKLYVTSPELETNKASIVRCINTRNSSK